MNDSEPEKLLLVVLNYAPELTGIGKYAGEMGAWFAARGVEVRVVTAPPYYPSWRVHSGYASWRYGTEVRAGVRVYRCPLWVPRAPRGASRILHLLSFAVSSLPVILWQALCWRPRVVLVVEPPLVAAPAAWIGARLAGARAWLHVQDLEVDAAVALGLLRARPLQRLAVALERFWMRRFDRVSAISRSMVERIVAKGVGADRVLLFPNWVDVTRICPTEGHTALRGELGIPDGVRVVLYSGNMGEKQGLDTLLATARELATDPTVLFLLCGDGAARARLQREAVDLDNVRFAPLQPLERLNALLNLADVHVLPQRVAAEDLVMPSKLTAMMASGRPVAATARRDSEVGRIVAECGLVSEPGDAGALAASIRRLLGDEALRRRLGAAGRAYALAHWDRDAVLERVRLEMRTAIGRAAA
jgi:colanic acid biosynthesis glycosyl transferase WcaI